MQTDPALIKEFLSEANQLITQDDYGKGLYDLLTPIRNLLLNRKDLLTFSIAKYAGADNRLAFFCEWFYLTNLLTVETDLLKKEDAEYLKRKIPLRLRGVKTLNQIVERDVERVFLPRQVAVLHLKTQEYIQSLVSRDSVLEKYLNKSYLNSFVSSEVASIKRIYQESQTMSDYLSVQGERSSFVLLGLPCLLGLTYYLNQPSTKNLGKSVKWVLLEELLKDIACLHQTASGSDFQMFVYASRLSEKDEYHWLSLKPEDRLRESLASDDAKEIIKNVREKIYLKAKNNLHQSNLPEKFEAMIGDLLEWSHRLDRFLLG
jgi:hypothetical protein